MLRKTLFAVLAIFFLWNLYTFFNVLNMKEASVENKSEASRSHQDIKSGSLAPILMSFIKSSGELGERVKYYERGAGHTTLFTRSGIFINLNENGNCDIRTLRIVPIDAEASLRIKSSGLQKGTLNYLVGNDPSKWQRGIQTYKRVIYDEIYDGIDIKFYGNNNQLEYDVVVNPGADPSAVKLRYEGVRNLKTDADGNLEIALGDRVIEQKKPKVFQIINDEYIEIEGSFKVFEDNLSQGFEVASYNKDYPLIIDPIISYSSYLGGSGNDSATGIAIDSSGNAYVAGITASTDFPITSAFQSVSGGGSTDAFVSKINSTATSLTYSSYLGGSDIDEANDIAVDSSGYALVTGDTTSSDFPLASAQFPSKSSLYDAFISKVDPSGSTLFQSTYFGGNDDDYGNGIAIDSNDDFYIAGTTYSDDLPVLTDAIQASLSAPLDGTSDIFVAKFHNSITYSTYLGGDKDDSGNAIAIGSAGNTYIVGDSNSSNFPLKYFAQKKRGGQVDVVVSMINSSGSELDYSIYFGGNKDDVGLGIAVDQNGNAYITGYTKTIDDFPLATSLQTLNGGLSDAFLAKLDPIITGTIEVRTNLAQATFSISGPENFNGSGTLWTTEAIAGVYTITMGEVAGYKTPTTKVKTLSIGKTLIFSKTYIATTGVITVTTNIDSAVIAELKCQCNCRVKMSVIYPV